MPSTPIKMSSFEMASEVRIAKAKRDALEMFARLSKANMTKIAKMYGGNVHYAAQHTMIEKLLDGLDKLDEKDGWIRTIQDGLSAGLASEWLVFRAWHFRKWHMQHCLVRGVRYATCRFGDTGPVLRTFLKHVSSAQDKLGTHAANRVINRDQLLSRAGLVLTGTFDVQYPFNNLDRRVLQRVKNAKNDCYYLIDGCMQTMAAFVDDFGWLEFYDPEVGEVTEMWGSPELSLVFLPRYLASRTDATKKVLEELKKVLGPGWSKSLGKSLGRYKEAGKLTFAEYTLIRRPLGTVPPKWIAALSSKTSSESDPGRKLLQQRQYHGWDNDD